MGKKIPYFFSWAATLAGNATASLIYQASQGETLYLEKIAVASTADANPAVAKSFTMKITDGNGQNYSAGSTGSTAADTNYSQGYIDSRLLGDGKHPTIMSQTLQLAGNTTLNLAIQETSGSTNLVGVMFFGYKELGNVVVPR